RIRQTRPLGNRQCINVGPKPNRRLIGNRVVGRQPTHNSSLGQTCFERHVRLSKMLLNNPAGIRLLVPQLRMAMKVVAQVDRIRQDVGNRLLKLLHDNPSVPKGERRKVLYIYRSTPSLTALPLATKTGAFAMPDSQAACL